MTYAHAIIIAAGIVAAAIIFTENTNADNLGSGGRFQLSSRGPVTAWRLDTETGQMMFCDNQTGRVRCFTEAGPVPEK